MVCPGPRQHILVFDVWKIATSIVFVAAIAFVIIGSQYFTVLDNHWPIKNDSYPGVPQPKQNLPLENFSEPQGPYHILPPEKGSSRIVLILAYMHTGSSYLGNLLRQHPKTFSLYEPLSSLKRKVLGDKTIKYLNGTEVHMTKDSYKHVGAQAVVDLFSCNYSKLDIATLTEKHGTDRVSLRNDHLEDYVQCLEGQCKRVREGGNSKIYTNNGVCGGKYFTDVQQTHQAIDTCLRSVITKCKQSKVRTIKMIRLSMDMTKLALQTFPNMRIIHLLRDPRAMLDSNHRHGEMGVHVLSEYRQRTEIMCDTMTTDLRISEKLKYLYPGKIFTLRYEDMVEDPMGIAKIVHDFAQVPFTNSAKMYVRSKNIDSKRNSTERASTWRGHIDQTHLNIVENACKDLFQKLGYRKLANIKEVRNLTVADHNREVNIV